MTKKNIGAHIKPSVSVSKSKGKQAKKTKSSGKGSKIFLILLGVFVIILVAGLLIQNFGKLFPKSTAKQDNAAVINGEAITMSDLDSYYNRLAPQTRASVTKEQLLDDMINKKILMKKSKELGITVNQSEIDAYIDSFLAQAKITKADLITRLATQNITLEMLSKDIEQQLILTKLYQQEILDKTVVNDSEIEAYYNSNIESFKTGEQVRAEHILICHNESFRCISNISKEDAFVKIENIKEMVNSSNFEELAKKYSQDPSADNGGDLGYFERGAMVKPFEDAAFSTEIGKISKVVETQYGFHILKVLDKKSATLRKIDDVKNEISQVLISAKQQETFKAYINDLKAKSDIKKIYFEKQITPAVPSVN